ATYRISIPDSGALTATKGAAKAVADVATATAQPMPHAIVGHSDGTIAFYGGAPVNAGTPRFATQPTRAITQVAMDAAATRAAAGDDQGRIFAYRLNITAGSNPFAQPYAPVDIGNAVTLLEMSADGTALLAGDGSAVTLLDLTGNDLRVVWKDTRRHAPYGGISRDGSLAVVAEAPATGTGAATTAVVYESRYRVAMQLPEILPAAVPKTSKEVIVGFANTGNRPTDVELGTGFPRGWFMTASPTQFRLEPGTTQNVTMRFVVPEREPPGDYDLWLNQTLRHPQAPSGATTANKVTVKVPDFNRLVLLDNGPTSLAIVAGGLATFELLAANGGNRDETSRILATITPGWEVRVEPSQVRLSPGQEERVQVTVQAPPALGIGASGRATVSLQNDPTQMVALQATVGAQFRPTLDGPAGMPVPPGNSTTFQLVVGNRGNAADTIRLGFEAATGPVPEGWRFAFLLGQETFEVKLDPGANANVTVVVQTPDAAPDGSALPMVFRATSLADPSKVAAERVTFTVTHAEPPVDDGGGRKGPSVGPAAILLVLVVVVVLLVVILGWQRGRT
ncbi:MAG TPA: NEW3 domain-containing protein, partial [Candidatus Thermoplasmatota archaeon]|nr:NEW3 domain-containing protein [Candidatus Thermoplasmatota archaeon]